MNNLRDRLGSTQRTLTLDHYSDSISSAYQSIKIPIYYNGNLMTSTNDNLVRVTGSSSAQWLSLSVYYTSSSGEISISCKENTTVQERTGTIDITYKGVTTTFTVTQAGCYPYVFENVVFLDKEQGSLGTLHILCHSDANDTSKTIVYDKLFDGSLSYDNEHTNYDVSYDGHGTFTFTAKNANNTGNQIREGFRPSCASRPQMDYVYIVQQPQFDTIDGHEYNSIPMQYSGLDGTGQNSKKWAVKFVGQTDPEDEPLFFQWGDTIGYTYEAMHSLSIDLKKQMYKYGDYDENNPSINGYYLQDVSPDYGYTKYNTTDNLTTLESSDDAATAIMGGGWRTPTLSETYSAFHQMYCLLASYNGAWGGAITYKNGSALEGGFYWVKNRFPGPSAGTTVDVPTSTVHNTTGYWDNTIYDGSKGLRISSTNETGYIAYRWDFTPVLAVHD